MKNQLRFIITLFLGVILLTSAGYTQNFLRIEDEIGGGGSGNANQSENSDNTALYVIAGAVVAGIITYVVISRMNKNNDEEKSDSSSAHQFSGVDLASGFDDFKWEYEKAQDKISVNLILGARNEKAFISEKTYLMGVSVRF